MNQSATCLAIEQLDAANAVRLRESLAELLLDAVWAGASIGFLGSMTRNDAIDYWNHIFTEVENDRRLLLVALEEDRIVGSVQLSLTQLPSGMHRGEVERLMVHTAHRRRGLGTALLLAVEEAALARGRHLLLLDTRAGDPAGKLYEKLGYIRAGVLPGYARSPSGKVHASAIYYRDLRDSDACVLGECDQPVREFA